MSAEYAPDALVSLGKKIAKTLKGGEFSGVLGDKSHTYGYHRARAVLPSSDYSVHFERDQSGDKWAASAVDVKFPPASQHTATRRLLAAAKKQDPRLKSVREFFGSTDGKKVVGWDLAQREPSTSDDSHLWHIHLSIFRKYANDPAAVAGIVEVIGGKDMAISKDDVKKIFHTDDSLSSKAMGYPDDYVKENPGMSVGTVLEISRRDQRELLKFMKSIDSRLKAIESKQG